MNGAVPSGQDEMIGVLLLDPIPQYGFTADGTVQPVAGGPCVGH